MKMWGNFVVVVENFNVKLIYMMKTFIKNLFAVLLALNLCIFFPKLREIGR